MSLTEALMAPPAGEADGNVVTTNDASYSSSSRENVNADRIVIVPAEEEKKVVTIVTTSLVACTRQM
jgi:hypothetical protein